MENEAVDSSWDAGQDEQDHEHQQRDLEDLVSVEEAHDDTHPQPASVPPGFVEEEDEVWSRLSSQEERDINSMSSDDRSAVELFAEDLPGHQVNSDRSDLLYGSSMMPVPSSHAYLGEAHSGTTYPRKHLEAGSTVVIPILSLPSFILFPGESLPLRLYNASYCELAKSILQGEYKRRWGGREQTDASTRSGAAAEVANNRGAVSSIYDDAGGHLGVVNEVPLHEQGEGTGPRSRGGGARVSLVGTTAEIRSAHSGGADADVLEPGMGIMARGRYRFRFLEDAGRRRGVQFWRVLISPDVCPRPLRAPVPRPFRDYGSSRSHWAMALPRFAVITNSPDNLVARAATLLEEEMGSVMDRGNALWRRTPARSERKAVRVPTCRREILSWAETRRVRRRTRRKPVAGIWAVSSSSRSIPLVKGDAEGKSTTRGDEAGEEGAGEVVQEGAKTDPTMLSFRLAANLPLGDEGRHELLAMDSVVMRLRMEVKYLEEARQGALCCSNCGVMIASVKDLFSLPGADGVMGAYVNPEGHVHETLTLCEVRNVRISGYPTVEHSWFPGYAWAYASCSRCRDHLGWHFTIVERAGTGRRGGWRSILPVASNPTIRFPSRLGGRGGGSDQELSQERAMGPRQFFGLRRPCLKYARGIGEGMEGK